jgi:aspartate racemase
VTPAHVGIVACSAEGAALCYRTICAEGAALLGPHAHPEISLHAHSLAAYVRCLERGDWPGVGELMLASAHKLAVSGADFLICPDNTIHGALPLIRARSPLPWLPIAEVVAARAAERGFRRLGLTGTRWLVDSEVYPDALRERGLGFVRPDEAARDAVNRIIMDELVAGTFRAESIARLQQTIAELKARGCDAVVLGCTELPLVLDDGNSPLPTLDSTRELARAALRRSVDGANAPLYARARPSPGVARDRPPGSVRGGATGRRQRSTCRYDGCCGSRRLARNTTASMMLT